MPTLPKFAAPAPAVYCYTLTLAAIFVAAAAQSLASSQSPSPSELPPAPEINPIMPPAYAPSPGMDCMPALLNMSDCLTYVENGSTIPKPDKACCPELANLVNTQPMCLCQLLGHPEAVGIPIDMSRALKLPSVCSVETPPVSTCAAIGIPIAGLGPAGAPAPGGMTVPPGLAPGPSESPSAGEARPVRTSGSSRRSLSLRCFPIGFTPLILLPFFFFY